MTQQILLPALLLSLACGGPSADAETDPTSDTSAGGDTAVDIAQASDAFVVAPFTLTDSGGSVLNIDANGQLTLQEQEGPSPRFSRDGRVTVNGETVLTMSPDGTLRTVAGDTLAVIGLDGSTTVGEYHLSFGPDGVVTGGNPSGPGVTLAPADSPAKRLAMTALILMTMSVDGPEGAVEESSPAP